MTQDIYSVVITQQSNPPISKFSRLCNELMIGQCSHTIPRVHCIHMYYLFCNTLVHVIYSIVSGQCSHAIIKDALWSTHT